MRKTSYRLRLAFLPAVLTTFLLGTFSSQAASVWKVSKNDNTVYLGGTLHILSPDDYPLPEQYDRAYKASDLLVFETDLAALESSKFVERTQQMMTYENGRTIRDDLSEETYAQLKSYLSRYGVSVTQVEKMKPSFLGITLSMMALQHAGLTNPGVDKYFFAKADADKKLVDWFETPIEQLEILSKLGEGEEDAYIRYSLEELDNMSETLAPMKHAWLNGDMSELFDSSMDTFKEDYPQIYANVLTRRNQAWLPKIEVYLTTPETEFVLVGTMHMAGPDGVISMLEQKGYTVVQLP